MVGQLKVTIATAPELRAEADRLLKEAVVVEQTAAKLRSDAVSQLVEAGMILVARASEWLPDNPAARYQVTAAADAIARLDDLGRADDGGARSRGLFARRGEQESPETRAERERRGAQLRLVLAELGRSFGRALAPVTVTQERALEMETRSGEDLGIAASMRAEAGTLQSEAGARELSLRELGFDAPLAAATMQDSPPATPKSPLQLHAGEVVYLVEPAELAREKALARPGPGERPDLPVAVSGILFSVGNPRRQAIARDGLSMLGAGDFVVTSQRLGFVGKLKSFAFALGDTVRVEHYQDGLGILREGRDNADVVLSKNAGRILFFVNYALGQQVAGEASAAS